MMRNLLLSILAIAATLGGHYAARIASSPKAPEGAVQDRVEVIKLEPISAPVIRAGKVAGYVIARISIAVPVDEAKVHKDLLIAFASEAVFRAIYTDSSFNFSEMRAADLSEISRRVVEFANKRHRSPAVREAVIESLNFVSQAEVQARRAK